MQAIWKAHGLSPHRWRTFKLSNDPAFAEKLTDIIGLYVDPPAHPVVLSVDETSQTQALDRAQPGLPMKKGRLRHRARGSTPSKASSPSSPGAGSSTASSVVDLQAAINRFVREYNADNPNPFTWKADPDDIIAARNPGFQSLESVH